MSGESGVQTAEAELKRDADEAESPREAEGVKVPAKIEIQATWSMGEESAKSQHPPLIEEEEMPTYSSLSSATEVQNFHVGSEEEEQQEEHASSEKSGGQQSTAETEARSNEEDPEKTSEDDDSVLCLSEEQESGDEIFLNQRKSCQELSNNEYSSDEEEYSSEEDFSSDEAYHVGKCIKEHPNSKHEMGELGSDNIKDGKNSRQPNPMNQLQPNPMNQMQPNPMRQMQRKPGPKSSHKYQHVPSKVKLYIQERQEEHRISLELRQKSQERTLPNEQKLPQIAEGAVPSEINQQRIQQLQQEYDRANSEHERSYTSMTAGSVDNAKQVEEEEAAKVQKMDVDEPIIEEAKFHNIKRPSMVNVNGEKRLQNGQQSQPVVVNACSVSYEEYMKSGQSSQAQEELDAYKSKVENLLECRERLELEILALRKELDKAESDKTVIRREKDKLETEKTLMRKELSKVRLASVRSEKRKETCTIAIQADLTENAPPTSPIPHLSREDSQYPSLGNIASKEFITSSRILETLSKITDKMTSDNESTIPGSSSKKRKAVEEVSEIGGMPFKIPNLRRNFSTAKDEASLLEQSKKEEREGYIDGVKYYVYEDNESKEQNFLIQAQEADATHNEGTGRECGPYRFGNVEVRMSELNGSINIYGKKLDQSIEPEASSSRYEPRNSLGLQMPGQPLLCSTERKPPHESVRERLNVERSHYPSYDRRRPHSPVEEDYSYWHPRSEDRGDECAVWRPRSEHYRPYYAARRRLCRCCNRPGVHEEEFHLPYRPLHYPHYEPYLPPIRQREIDEDEELRHQYRDEERAYCNSKRVPAWSSRLLDSVPNTKADGSIIHENHASQKESRFVLENKEATQSKRSAGMRARTVMTEILKGYEAQKPSGSSSYASQYIPNIVITPNTPVTSEPADGRKDF